LRYFVATEYLEIGPWLCRRPAAAGSTNGGDPKRRAPQRIKLSAAGLRHSHGPIFGRLVLSAKITARKLTEDFLRLRFEEHFASVPTKSHSVGMQGLIRQDQSLPLFIRQSIFD
jgi:hypothetical protein